MKKIIVIQQVEFEGLGIIEPILKNHQVHYDIFLASKLTSTLQLENYQGLIVLGGPMGVYEQLEYPYLDLEIKIIREMIKKRKMVLGICLGAQLICKALGGEVKPDPRKELGWYPITLNDDAIFHDLFQNFGKEEMVFHWHGDQCQNLPADIILLASSKICPVQAFQFDDYVFGLQFHLEVDEKIIHTWLAKKENQKLLSMVKEETSKEKIVSETAKHISGLNQVGKIFFEKLIQKI